MCWNYVLQASITDGRTTNDLGEIATPEILVKITENVFRDMTQEQLGCMCKKKR